jgi:hypothetical protein
MSFTREETIRIAQILNIDRLVLEDHIALYPTEIDSTVEGLVRDEITRWDGGISDDFVSVEPNIKNFGARIDPSIARSDVKKNIANYLLIKMQFGGSGWGYSTRS